MLWISLLFVVTACGDRVVEEKQSEPKATAVAAKQQVVIRSAERGLMQHVAQLRFAQVANPRYRVDLSLNKEREPFTGSVTIGFDFTPQGSPLTIDYAEGTVLTVSINGEVSDYQYNGFFISLSEDQLRAGSNEVTISFSHDYSRDGAGLYYYTDPLDLRVYTYSDLEPFDANKIFPLFDQPDLKAKFTISADVPAAWQVVSTMRETSIIDNGDRKIWHFPQTPSINSYAFSIHAGDYVVFDLGQFEGIPLRLFSRHSNAEYVPVDEWNKATRQGFAFFNEFFGVAYPFGKYDQLAVPDFNSGAMENIGAVTFADQYCCRKGERTLTEKSFFLNSVLHEQAHMWFGNLVTMKWWNDIWLNESFAEFAGYLALEGGTDFEDPWLEFLWARKTWGYRDDDYVTTHPILLPLQSTNNVMSAIDGITYAKGASLLRQLSYFIGDDKFRAGLRNYMKKYAYGNTELNDLLSELSDAAGTPLEQWAQMWMGTTGVNRIATDLSCRDGKIETLNLIQSSVGEDPTLRLHRFKMALYDEVDGVLQEPDVIDVRVEGETTSINSVSGRQCPALILPNIGDYAFFKVILDQQSRDNLKAHLSSITDPHARALFWIALWDGVSDGRYPLTEYFDIVLRHIEAEDNPHTINGFRVAVNSARAWLLTNRDNVDVDSAYQNFNAKIMALAEKQMALAPVVSDEFYLWLRFILGNAGTDAQLQQLATWMEDGKIGSWTIDQRQRWNILMILAEHRHPRAMEWLQAELKLDGSSTGERSYLHAQSRYESNKGKMALFQSAISPDNTNSLNNLRSIIRGLNNFSQSVETRDLLRSILSQFLTSHYEMNSQLVREFTRANIPFYWTCLPSWSTFIDEQINSHPDMQKDVENALKESKQNNGRCVQAVALLDR